MSITVNGCVSLDGELILQLDSLPETDVNITSLYYECVVGTFRTIDTVAPSQKDCNAPSVSPTYGSSSLVILLSPSSHCGRGLSTGAIIGIAVGGGIVLIALVMLVVLVLLRRSRNPFVKRIFSRSARRPPPSSRGVVY